MTAARDSGEGRLERRAEAALRSALGFLESVQRPSGEIPVDATSDPRMRERLVPDPSVFPTALAVHSLGFAGEAARHIVAPACRFLLGEMDEGGLWRHWVREHPHHAALPPDLDDTCCASAALARAGYAIPNNRAVVAANRLRNGMFLTWLVPQMRWTGAAHLRATLPRLRHPAALLLFFRRTSARPGDADAVVNANVLHYLGAIPGSEPVVAELLRTLAAGREAQADKWYDNPIVVRYFLSRALAGIAPEAEATLVARSEAAVPTSALEAALLICTLADWGRTAPQSVREYLLGAQLPSGGWPAAAVYHGGRRRLAQGGFAEPHPDTPRWGSEALTTSFCIEALCRDPGLRR